MNWTEPDAGFSVMAPSSVFATVAASPVVASATSDVTVVQPWPFVCRFTTTFPIVAPALPVFLTRIVPLMTR